MRIRDNKTWFNIDESLEKLISQIKIKGKIFKKDFPPIDSDGRHPPIDDNGWPSPINSDGRQLPPIDSDGWQIEIMTWEVIFKNEVSE